jgi:hypothetical protein
MKKATYEGQKTSLGKMVNRLYAKKIKEDWELLIYRFRTRLCKKIPINSTTS